MTWQTYTRGFERTFPRGSTIRPQGAGVEVSIPCAHGHDRTDHYTAARLPMDKLKTYLVGRGWTFRGKKSTCPDCNQKKREEAMERVTSIDVPAVAKLPVTTDARKAKREVMTWLDQSFNVDKGRYDEGVSDASIAKETGMAEQAVATLREEFYGPLREPVEVANFRKRLTDVETAVDNIEAQAKDTFSAIREQVAKLASELAAIVKRNGW